MAFHRRRRSLLLAPAVEALLVHDSPLVRGMAVWALGRLVDVERFEALRRGSLLMEPDLDVKTEWDLK